MEKKVLTPIELATLNAAKENFKKFINPSSENELKLKELAIKNIKELEPSFLEQFTKLESSVQPQKKEKKRTNKEKEAEGISLALDSLIANNNYRKFSILKYFKFGHLNDENLRNMSMNFARLAVNVVSSNEKNPVEKSACLRKLLEAKDCAVRMLI